MARFGLHAPSSLIWGRGGISVPFYSVRDCKCSVALDVLVCCGSSRNLSSFVGEERLRDEPKDAQCIWVIDQPIDQACSVSMAGYCLSSFFACLWTETKSEQARNPERAVKLHLARSGTQSERAKV